VCDDGVYPPRRDMCTLVAVGGDVLLLFGGRSESTRAIGDLWLFDIKLCAPAPLQQQALLHITVGVRWRGVVWIVCCAQCLSTLCAALAGQGCRLGLVGGIGTTRLRPSPAPHCPQHSGA
jgi:hypothetical protein